jgi:outer membrane lipoprotein carrier protein
VNLRWAFLPALVVQAFGAEPDLPSLLRAVENRYNRAQTLEVLFQEGYTAPGRSRRTESGKLRLRKPGRMRWDYTSPPGKLFVSDGKNLWLYTPDNRLVQKTGMKSSEDLRAPMGFLLGKLNFDKEFQNIRAEPDAAGTRITAEPKVGNLPYEKVEFVVGPNHEILRLMITQYDRSLLEFTFQGERLNPPLDAKLFRFEMPPGAQLSEESGQ